MLRTACRAVAVVALAALVLGCASDEDARHPTLEERLQDALDSSLEASGTPAASAAIIFPDGSTWAGATGVADRDADRSATTDTLFAVASITKTFTASLVFRLAEQHHLSIDDPLDRWVPEFPGAADITLRDLLGHTSGVGRSNEFASSRPTRRWTPTEVLREVEPPACGPGTCLHYSDTNYVLLGLVAERAGGRPFEELLHGELLDPLGLDDTYLQGVERPSRPVASVYENDQPVTDGTTNVPTTDFVTRSRASGALASTASDIAEFGHHLLVGSVVDPRSLAAMTDFDASDALPSVPPGDLTGYGLGFEARLVANREAVGHSGSTGSVLAHFPDARVTIAVLLNGAPGFGADPDAVIESLVRELPELGNGIDLHSVTDDGSSRERLTTDPGIDTAPAPSPDGSHIAFVSDRTGDAEVYRMGADGSDVERLTHRPDSLDTSPAWSPDGTRLVFSSNGGDDPGLYVMDADGSALRRLPGTGNRDRAPSWAPNGSRIAFHRTGGGHVEIVVADVGSGADHLVVSERGDVPMAGFPRWSPDGSQLVFVGIVDGVSPEVKSVRVDNGEVRRLTFNHTLDRFPTWGPDGRIAFVRRGDLAVMDGNGGNQQLVATTEQEEFLPAWAPRQDRILFASASSSLQTGDR